MHRRLRFCSLAATITYAALAGADPSSFYVKKLDAQALTIRGSVNADAASLAEAKTRVARLTEHAPKIAANMKSAGVELHLIARSEKITDLPEFQAFRNAMERTSGQPFSTRYHGGKSFGTVVACTEENLFKDKSDPYPAGYDVCFHETTHAVFNYGLDASLRKQVDARYSAALTSRLYENQYAASSVGEFFAELSGKYFAKDHGGLDASDPDTLKLLDAIYSGRSAPGPSPTATLKPLPASPAPVTQAGAAPSGVEIFNRSTATLRDAYVSAQGNIETSVFGYELPPGAEDVVGLPAGSVIALIDEKNRQIVARVRLEENFGRFVVTDAIVKSAKPGDVVETLAPLPIAPPAASSSVAPTVPP